MTDSARIPRPLERTLTTTEVDGAGEPAGSAEAGATPQLTIVVPTKNEEGNVAALVARLEGVAPDRSVEVLFVDDSDDGTPQAVEEAARRSFRHVRLLHREANDRSGGLAGAVVAGFRAARAPWICVLDGDLQHPPELIERMCERAEEEEADIVVASRYCDEAAPTGFGLARAALSRCSNSAARLLFPRRLRGVRDTMSGFFLVRGQALDVERLRPQGFKILLEILVTHPRLRRAEVPFEFGTRHAGHSKASLRQGLLYLSQLARLRLGNRLVDFIRFAFVGASGLLVNMALFALFASALGFNYLVAALLATQGSTFSNFMLTEHWVFSSRRRHGAGRSRFALYFLVNNASLLIRGPLLVIFVGGLGLGALVANFLSLVALTVLRFAVADSFIWRRGDPWAGGPHAYDIHGILSVVSDVALPELAAFRVDGSPKSPTIRVRTGRLSAHQSELVAWLAPQTRHIRYDEGLGPFGFAIEISVGKTVEVLAAPVLRLSPHVLYTNAIEPILRWAFVKKGYALVHGACVAFGDAACLITARTDTGKTTTILKMLDSGACSFLSDDLTLLSPSGRVLNYPKPLTISRHTMSAVKTPLLTVGERARLFYQSRVHSRSGRQFALRLAQMRLPAATINAFVQTMVPPPKYPIQRLVPNVEVAYGAQLCQLVVIERGAEGVVELGHEKAVDILLSNCEDAYGFPPYPAIASLLHSRNGRDLRLAERRIVATALGGVPATLLRSETMGWWESIERVRSSHGFLVREAAFEPAPAS